MDTKTEQERNEIHKTIWSIADDLRGAVDGWDFKSYVLGIMFYRYISENIANYITQGEWNAGNKTFDYAKLPDEEAKTIKDDMVKEKGFFILPSELFCNVCKNAKNEDAKFTDKDGKAQSIKENLNIYMEQIFNIIKYLL